jgi:hypothetical protein
METNTVTPTNSDLEHLNLLAIFHYVVGAIGLVFACFPMIHLAIGIAMIVGAGTGMRNGDMAPAFIGYLFVGIATFLIVLGWTMAICTIISGRFIAARKNRTFSFVLAAILCFFMPFGTVLGVFTIVLLNKDSVKALYGALNGRQVRGGAN